MNADLTIKEALLEGARCIYRETHSDEASLEAEILLGHALDIAREQLYRRLNDPLGEGASVFESLIGRRCAHEPTPYITGRREFFGLDFEVSPAVLIPRPETETLVEAVIAFANERFGGERFSMADVGTGCGTIAIAVAQALSNARIIAIDESADALTLAARNAETLGVHDRPDFRRGDLLAPLTETVDIIAANLPYVTTADWQALPTEIREWEPRSALDGGPDGLVVIGRLLQEAPRRLRSGGALFAEIGDEQGTTAAAIARQGFPDALVEVLKDLAGRDRVLVCLTEAELAGSR